MSENPPHITERQRQVLVLIAKEHPNKQIADMLGISVKTAEKHRQLLLRNFETNNTIGLLRLAFRHHILDVNVWLQP